MVNKNKNKTSHSIDLTEPTENRSREKRSRFCSKSMTKKRLKSKKIR